MLFWFQFLKTYHPGESPFTETNYRAAATTPILKAASRLPRARLNHLFDQVTVHHIYPHRLPNSRAGPLTAVPG